MNAYIAACLYVTAALLWAVTIRAMGTVLGIRYRCRAMFWLRVAVGIMLYGISAALVWVAISFVI